MKIIKHLILIYIKPASSNNQRKKNILSLFFTVTCSGSARTMATTIKISTHSVASMEWVMQWMADFRLYRDVERIYTVHTIHTTQMTCMNTMVGSKYFCSSQIITCAFMHILYDVQCYMWEEEGWLWPYCISNAMCIMLLCTFYDIIGWMDDTVRHNTTTTMEWCAEYTEYRVRMWKMRMATVK